MYNHRMYVCMLMYNALYAQGVHSGHYPEGSALSAAQHSTVHSEHGSPQLVLDRTALGSQGPRKGQIVISLLLPGSRCIARIYHPHILSSAPHSADAPHGSAEVWTDVPCASRELS